MRDSLYYLAVFDSTNAAILAQKLLDDLAPVMMPTLREISASCGMSLRLEPALAQAAARRLRDAQLRDWRIYRVEQSQAGLSCTLAEE